MGQSPIKYCNINDDKFSVLAKNYYELLEHCQLLREDLVVVCISHIENYGTDTNPEYRLWTTGK